MSIDPRYVARQVTRRHEAQIAEECAKTQHIPVHPTEVGMTCTCGKVMWLKMPNNIPQEEECSPAESAATETDSEPRSRSPRPSARARRTATKSGSTTAPTAGAGT